MRFFWEFYRLKVGHINFEFFQLTTNEILNEIDLFD